MRTPATYAAITPARNEAVNLRRLAASMDGQTIAPKGWVIVDDNSTDETVAVAESLAVRKSWISVMTAPATPATATGTATGSELNRGRGQGRDVLAFVAGVGALASPPDIVLKLDADVSFDEGFFERLLRAFATDHTLGIAGGVCLEWEADEWVERFVTGDHVRGAVRAYRWNCFKDVTPLVPRLGWDGIDELKARTLGWTTRALPELPFHHHRSMGSRDGRWRTWAGQGSTAAYMGYRPSYLFLRALHHCRRDPAAVAMLGGYTSAVLRRTPQHPDRAVCEQLRSEQRLRFAARRFREATGRRVRSQRLSELG